METARHLPGSHKFKPPRLPNVLCRRRLFKQLESHKEKKVILILGQAAQGKSTLAASYLHQLKLPVSWVNLEPEDCDPVNLLHSLAGCLREVFPAADFSQILQYPNVTVGPRAEGPLYRRWTQMLFNPIAAPVYLVLDGLDRLSGDAPCFAFLKVLIDELPARAHLFLLSRQNPPIDIQRFKIRQEAFVLDNQSLAFTLEETREFFRQVQKVPLPATQLKRIHKLTEGWVGGLVLLNEFLERFPAVSSRQIFGQELSGDLKSELFQYFSDEIFSSQPQAVQTFLLQASTLDVLEPGFLKELTGVKAAVEILQDLARRNLFIHSFYDPQSGWSFRIHQLFRDFLKARFESEMDIARKKTLLLKAGGLYEQREQRQEAIKCYLEAKCYPQAVDMIEKVGLDLLRNGRTGDFADWLQALPPALIPEHPWLLFYRAMTTRFTKAVQSNADLQRALVMFQEQGDERGHLLALAYLIGASIIRGRDQIPLNELLEHAERLLESLSPDCYGYERAILWSQIGLAYNLRAGNPRKGYRASYNAYLIAKEAGVPVTQVSALTYAVMGLSFLGEFSRADELCRKLDRLVSKYDYPEFQCIQLITYSLGSLFRGDLQRCAQLVSRAQEMAEQFGLVYLYPMALFWELWLKVYSAEREEVETIGRRLLDLAALIENLFLQGTVPLLLGLFFYHRQDYLKAAKYIQRSREVLSSKALATSGHHIFSRISIVVMGLLSLHLGNASVEDENGLLEALDHFEDIANHLLQVDTCLALALMRFARKNRGDAAVYLQQGFKIARQRGYHHLILMSPRDLALACLLAVELNIRDVVDYAAALLADLPADLAAGELKKLLHSPNREVRSQACRLQAMIHRRHAPRLVIETLGEFTVLLGDAPVPDSQWKGARSKLLLKAIVAHRSREVPQERLMEALWPESSMAAAESNLKSSLHRLRKVLEPDLEKSLGSRYVHLKDGLVSLDAELCDVDAEKFLMWCNQALEQSQEGMLKEALVTGRKAIALYRGDFLPGDVYYEWADGMRKRLKQNFIELLHKMAEISEKQGAMRRATRYYEQLRQIDPLTEESYQRLMTLYFNRGLRNAALDIYTAYNRMLALEPGSKPSPIIMAIYQKILESS